jgi:hypothetical protein
MVPRTGAIGALDGSVSNIVNLLAVYLQKVISICHLYGFIPVLVD